jgi:hypothetical protein
VLSILSELFYIIFRYLLQGVSTVHQGGFFTISPIYAFYTPVLKTGRIIVSPWRAVLWAGSVQIVFTLINYWIIVVFGFAVFDQNEFFFILMFKG